MPNVQIKDVPTEVHGELRRRAGATGRSLQEYLLALLIEETSRPPLDEVLARAGGRSGGRVDFSFSTQAVRRERDDR